MPGASKSMDFDAWSMPGAPQRGLERLREAPECRRSEKSTHRLEGSSKVGGARAEGIRPT